MYYKQHALPVHDIMIAYTTGPRTQQLKLQKVVIFHTHYNFFSQLQRFFQQFYIWTTIFT